MITTILLDLDNTLLGNDMQTFLPAYFTRLEQHLHPLLQGRDLISMMRGGVQKIIAQDYPKTNNYEIFMAHFCQEIGRPIAEIEPVFQAFYEQDYREIEPLTQFRPAAPKIVRYLLEQQYKVVIATNPLFPEVAIRQRLAWAGLSEFVYHLVTTMENSTACKPDVRYYETILQQVDSLPHECWMVGDDIKNDIIPANELGLQTWWIPDINHFDNAKQPPSDNQGTLQDFWKALQSGLLIQD